MLFNDATRQPFGRTRGRSAACRGEDQMKNSHADAIALDRREVLQRLAALAATSLLAGCPWKSSPATAPTPTAEIDIHCHIFNVRDMPAYAFILDVAIDNPLLHSFAAPLAKLMVEIVRGWAPDYTKELAVLQTIRANPGVAASVAQNSALPVAMFVGGLLRFLDKYTSFKLTPPGPLWSPANDEFVLQQLFARFLPGVPVPAGMTNAQTLAFIQLHANELATNILAAVQAPGGSATAALDAGSYLAQFLLYWAPRLADYRFQLASQLAALYGGTTSVPRLMTPATLDITRWLKDSVTDDVPTPLLDQAELMRLIALIQPPAIAVHGFIGFDPWRQVDDLANGRTPTALDVVKIAIEQKGFVGVKLYPPMGFRATGNATIADCDFPEWMVACVNASTPKFTLGPKLDAALDSLYAYCVTNDVPIMAHCAGSQGTSQDAALRADPKFWQMVLDKPAAGAVPAYGNMRLNLGHFGGLWNFDGAPPVPPDTHVTWTADVAKMIQSGKYPNLYTDIGDFAAILDRSPAEKADTKLIVDKLTQLVKDNPLLKTHLMYGTDWLMLGREPGSLAYYKKMTDRIGTVLNVTDLNDFLWRNASRYLGLATGKATRTRLANFYTANGGDANKLAQFGGP
jgi:predicted TIM-barrel fold metal-dependent hydrolase